MDLGHLLYKNKVYEIFEEAQCNRDVRKCRGCGTRLINAGQYPLAKMEKNVWLK